MDADRGAGTSDFDRALTDFTDTTRRRAAATERLQAADHAMVAGLSGSWFGTLVELAESGRPILAITRSGAHHRGAILAVGPTLVVLAPTLDGPRTLLRLPALEAVRESGDGRVRDADPPAMGPDLGSLLDEASEDRARVSIVTAGGNRFAGRILRVGIDQVTLRLDGQHDALTIPLGRIDEAVIDR